MMLQKARRVALISVPDMNRWGLYPAALFALLTVLMWVRPMPGWAISILGLGAVIVAVRSTHKMPLWEEICWIVIAFALCGAEMRTLYKDRADQEQASADARAAQTRNFLRIANGLSESIKQSQQQFAETMSKSREAIAESTGGDSFCYVDMGGWNGNELIANIVQKGRYPLFRVDVTITDIDAFNLELKSKSGTLGSTSRRGFPTIDVLTRVSLWRPLGTYLISPDEESRSFNIEMFARNGAFVELLRIRKLKEGGLTTAKLVSASYFTNKRGIVLEQIDKTFPSVL